MRSREFGPDIFQRLAQGSQARERAINQASKASYIEQESNLALLPAKNKSLRNHLANLFLAGNIMALVTALSLVLSDPDAVKAAGPGGTPTSLPTRIPTALPAPTSVIVTRSEHEEINIKIEVQSPAPAPGSSVDDAIKIAGAIGTITQANLNEKATATARAASPTPYLTPRPLQVELQGPLEVRLTDNRGLPGWFWFFVGAGLVGLAVAGYANREIIEERLRSWHHDGDHDVNPPTPPITPPYTISETTTRTIRRTRTIK